MADYRLSLAEYAEIVEQAPMLIWRADTSMGCDYFNDRWLMFTGRTLEQELGNGWSECVHPEDLQRCLDIYTNAFKNREVFAMEYRLRRYDGVYRWIVDRGAPYNDPQGIFSGYIGSCVDITDRVEAQEALRKAKEEELLQLRGLLPICTHCKKIRDDKGFWQRVENYVSQHSRAAFTHGICPDCLEKYYPKPSSGK